MLEEGEFGGVGLEILEGVCYLRLDVGFGGGGAEGAVRVEERGDDVGVQACEFGVGGLEGGGWRDDHGLRIRDFEVEYEIYTIQGARLK